MISLITLYLNIRYERKYRGIAIVDILTVIITGKHKEIIVSFTYLIGYHLDGNLISIETLIFTKETYYT